MKPSLFLAAVASLLPGMPAAASDAADVPARVERHEAALPAQLNADQRAGYASIFSAIRSGDWTAAAARLDAMTEGPLHPYARAELFLAKGSPKVELPQILPLLAKAPDMPAAPQLARLAEVRGAIALPALPEEQRLLWVGEQPRRERPRGIAGDPLAAEIEPLFQPLIVGDQPQAAEALLTERGGALTPEALTQFRQRIAWSYYLTGYDREARRMADAARAGIGEWALQGEWVAGLAAWRMGDCAAAVGNFAAVGLRATDQELSAAGHYWAARADMRCGHPERVQARLRSAARMNETFYGLLAASALGIKALPPGLFHNYRDEEWREIAGRPNVRAAMALAEIGEKGLADECIKREARIGDPRDHDALLHLASDLNLASTQFWLAHNAPRGARVNMAARYPDPDWRPRGGWRVDPALVFAHTLQESSFRTEVVSPAGAYGLMQVRPGTAGDMARARGEAFDRTQLSDPAANFEYGQSYLEYLRDQGATQGLLPKVIAAYNAGPAPISEWNLRARDQGDPLLYIESIPYWETRGYVPIVLRNYWVYEEKLGSRSTSRQALAQGLWPRFPGAGNREPVRLGATRPQGGSGGSR